jgi:hypothetical protein
MIGGARQVIIRVLKGAFSAASNRKSNERQPVKGCQEVSISAGGSGLDGTGACSSLPVQQQCDSVVAALSVWQHPQICSSGAKAAKQHAFAGSPTNKANNSAISFFTITMTYTSLAAILPCQKWRRYYRHLRF